MTTNRICIDIGNTNIKAALYDNDTLVDTYNGQTPEEIIKKFEDLKLKSVAICSVRNRFFTSPPWKVDMIELSHFTPIPIKNNYKSKETLGMDRLAAAIGANAIYKDQNILIIDAGTSITYDVVVENSFLGGIIAPGLFMRMNALHTFTGQLPLLTVELSTTDLIGNTTKTSMMSGVINGASAEIKSMTMDIVKEYAIDTVIFSGGDGKFLAEQTACGIFAAENLVLRGLYEVLEYNGL